MWLPELYWFSTPFLVSFNCIELPRDQPVMFPDVFITWKFRFNLDACFCCSSCLAVVNFFSFFLYHSRNPCFICCRQSMPLTMESINMIQTSLQNMWITHICLQELGNSTWIGQILINHLRRRMRHLNEQWLSLAVSF